MRQAVGDDADLGRRVRMPLALQIVGLLLAGLVAAQATTLFLALLLPPPPLPEYRLSDIAGALKGGSLAIAHMRPLVRTVRPAPPGLGSRGWQVHEQSQGELARLLGAKPSEVRLMFYSPLPFAGGPAPRPPRMVGPNGRLGLLPGGPWSARALELARGGPRGEQPAPGVFSGGGPNGGIGGGMGGGPGGIGPGGMGPGGGFPTSRPNGSPGGGGFPGGRPGGVPTTSQPTSTRPSPIDEQAPDAPIQTGPTEPRPGAPTSGPTSGPGPIVIAPPPHGRPGRHLPPIFAPSPLATGLDGPMIFDPPESVRPDHPARPTGLPDATLARYDHRPSAAPAAQAEPVPPTAVATPVAAVAVAATSEPATATASSRSGWVLPAPVAHGLFGLAPAGVVDGDFVAAFQEAPGRWVAVQPAPEPFPTQWQQRLMLWFANSFSLVAPIGYLFARRLVAPFAAFATAAERLGRDPSGPVIALRGPAEIGRAATAFNLMQQRLKRYIDDRTAMVGAISHDLRTPLARIRFRVDAAPPRVREGVLGDVAQMEEMVTAVLAFIRDASEPGLRERVDLRSILECVVDDAALMGGDAALDPGAPASVEVDPLSVQRVVTNLVENALKYGRKAHVRLFTDGADAVTEVVDAGPGLPDEELERVFLPFYRAERARTLNTGGIGLGLSVSRSIARAHGGDVRLFRQPDGLVAQLRLPLAA